MKSLELLTLVGLVGIPFLGFVLLCCLGLSGVALPERSVARLCRGVMLVHLATVLGCLIGLWLGGNRVLALDLEHWYLVGEYRFELALLIDAISGPLLLVTSFLLNVIGYFCVQYLHRDRGYLRFCALYLLFASGISLVIAAGTIDLLFAGWEILGMSSALLIGFYHERRGPAENGFYAFVCYRFCDVALLCGTVMWHHYVKTSEIPLAFAAVGGAPLWKLTHVQFFLVAMLFVIASLAKSAQLPMSSWLPRAMEGPTPSSAIFYGALSIHAGAYLLLRLHPILAQSPEATSGVILIGACTALYGAFVGRTRADVKNMLAYAALSQVGLIYIEIGLGWLTLATLHIIGHSLVRSLQFLRAPSVLHDFRHIGYEPFWGPHSRPERLFPHGIRNWLYRQALVECNLDTMLRVVVGRPIARLSRGLKAFESRVARSLIASPPQHGEPT